jgi:G3E family GTPase
MTTPIPTNIITGFLGVGKTTAITHLLKHKPASETWSVLVNEFGEIGIDGALLQQVNAEVREVAGGCICCVGGLPMKMALNRMIARTQPDRIIIEPTGLGHPEEIILTLVGEYYAEVLDLRATITLLDPRKLSDSRYTDNANFQDQLALADVLVANKTDLCGAAEQEAFNNLVARFNPAKAASHWVQHGQLQGIWLDFPRSLRSPLHPQHHEPQHAQNRLNPRRELYNSAVSLPPGVPFLRRSNAANGFYSCGWLFQPALQFDFNTLFGWLSGADFWRVKAVLRTNAGIFMFNAEQAVLSVNELKLDFDEDLQDSRIEIIDAHAIAAHSLEQILLGALVAPLP